MGHPRRRFRSLRQRHHQHKRPHGHTSASTSRLVDDVQSWLTNPDGNYGWLVLGDESRNQTTNRFNTKENEDSESGPVLVVEYRPG